MMKVICSNIRFDMEKDGAHRWVHRAPILSELINGYLPDLVATQEGLRPQLYDLRDRLQNLTLVDGHRPWIADRMYPCLFFNAEKFKLIDSGDIWLSETPDIAGTSSFDSAYPRLCTWAILEDIKVQKRFIFTTTHLDHVLESTRESQALVLASELLKIKVEHNLPMILCGDFNDDPKSKARKIIAENLILIDHWSKFQKEEFISFHKWGKIPEDGARIDWILTDKKIECLKLSFDTRCVEGLYPSDHYPLIGEFTI